MKLSSQTLLETPRFTVVQVRSSKPSADSTSSTEVVRQVVRHPGAVVILPLLQGDRVCLIKNYRVSVDETLLELPAGTLEPDEAPRQTAARELREETGYRAKQLDLVHRFYLSPGILDERMHLFVARQLTAGSPAREPGEQIENLIVDLAEALAMVHDGRIHDAKTIIGLLLYDQLRRAATPRLSLES